MILARIAGCLFLIITSFIIHGCSTAPEAIRIKSEEAGHGLSQSEAHIHIVNHGWHTGIILKAADLNKILPELEERFPSSVYYEIGWGDAGFYQADEITSSLTLQALFYSTGAVIHIAGFRSKPGEFFAGSDIAEVTLGAKGYQGLLEFIKSSFYIGVDGKPVSLKKGIYGNSQFYQGFGRYHAFNTCNTWTAKALSSAGFDIFCATKLTSGSVMGYIKEYDKMAE